jgi:hypothetical protein
MDAHTIPPQILDLSLFYACAIYAHWEPYSHWPALGKPTPLVSGLFFSQPFQPRDSSMTVIICYYYCAYFFVLICVYVCVCDRVSPHSTGWPGTCCVAQAALELMTLLP